MLVLPRAAAGSAATARQVRCFWGDEKVAHSYNQRSVRDGRYSENAAHGRYRQGAGYGIAGKLNSHMFTGGATRYSVYDKSGQGKTREVVMKGEASSLAASDARQRSLEYREALAERFREEEIMAMFDKKEVKRVPSFTRVFGQVTDKTRASLIGVGLSKRRVKGGGDVDRDTPADAAMITATGGGFAAGGERPKVLNSFKQLKGVGAPDMLILALEEMGWDNPTTIQGALWVAAESHRDLVALSLPGSGKTAAYLVPAILRVLEVRREEKRAATATTSATTTTDDTPGEDSGHLAFHEEEPSATSAPPVPRRETTYEGPCARPLAAVVVPTAELARQVYAAATDLCNPAGVTAGFCAGRSGRMPRSTEVLIGTAYRIGQLAAAKKVSLADVRLLVVDEADYMLTHRCNDVETLIMKSGRRGGAGAAPAKKRKKKTKKGKKKAQVAAASPVELPATPAVAHEAVQEAAVPAGPELQLAFVASTWSETSAAAVAPWLKNAVVMRVAGGVTGEGETAHREAALPSVQHRVHVVPPEDRAAFISMMFTTKILPLDRHKYIVFASAVRDVERLYDVLFATLPPGSVRMVHEEQFDYQRQVAMDAMRSEDTVRVLVATDLIARGIDFPNISGVVSFDLADSLHTLFQRMGRTGRVRRHGVAHTFVSEDTPRDRLEELANSLQRYERHEALDDLLRGDGEKSLFVQKLEAKATQRAISFDSVDTAF